MLVEVLGPIRLRTGDGAAVAVAERQLRLLLGALVAAGGEPVSADAMIERLWGDDLPADPRAVLQAKLSRLRTALDRAQPGARKLLIHTPAGYRLALETDALDDSLFRTSVQRARGMAPSPQKAESLTRALGLWGGEPFGDVADEVWLEPAIAELHAIRVDAGEVLAETLLEIGDPHRALSEAIGILANHPTREGVVGSAMIALYQVGRQQEALDMFEGLRCRLAEELGVDPSPRLRELHCQILRQDPTLLRASDAGTSAHPLSVPASIPAEIGPLIGRREMVGQIGALLDEARLVTLTGIGGVGKTRLAVHVARGLAEQGELSTWFVDLTELSGARSQSHSGQRIALQAAGLLGLHFSDIEPNPLARLVEALGPRPTLLVLDNCEHIVAEAALFTSELLRRAPQVRVLATSRQPLGLAEEQRCPVDPLSTEPGTNGEPSEAARFFLSRARASAPAFHLDAHNAEAVNQLCWHLDGLPLALELATARLPGLSVADLLERISDRLSLLRRPAHAAPRRLQTLRGMIDWSWSLLDETEQAVLRRMVVHLSSEVQCRPSMDLEAIEAICADDHQDPATVIVHRHQVLDTLLGLVDRNLVTMTSTATGVRYALLESIAAYAGEQLVLAAEDRSTIRRHLHHYSDLARKADAGLRGRHQRHWLARLAADRGQLGLAFELAVRARDGLSAAALTLASFWHQMCVPGFSVSTVIDGYRTRLADDLETVLTLPGITDDDRTALTTLAASLDATRSAGGRRVEEALARFDGPSVPKARVQWFAGTSLLSAGLRGAGERHVDEALASLADLGEDWDLAVAACRRDWLMVTSWGEPPKGLPDGRDLHEVLAQVDDGYGSLHAHAVEHRYAELLGDHRRSAVAVAAALELSRQLGIGSEISLWLTASAIAAARDGAMDRSVRELAESRSLATRVGSAVGLAYADLAEAMLARHGDDLPAARSMLDRWRSFTGSANAELSTDFEQGFLAVQEGDAAASRVAFVALSSSIPLHSDTPTTARIIELAAAIRTAEDDSRGAAELLGAAEAVRGRAGAGPSVLEQRDIQRVRERLTETLSTAEISLASSRGGTAEPTDWLAMLPGPADSARMVVTGGPARAPRSRSPR